MSDDALHNDEEIDVYEDMEAPLTDKPLLPRQRKLCELLAQGKTSSEIARILHYSPSRVAILRQDPRIEAESTRLRTMVFEESVLGRLKKMADPALNVIEAALTDKTNRYKKSEQIQVAQWTIEKLDGKATQKVDIGENILGVMMDKLDALKNSGKAPEHSFIDVTPQAQIEGAPPREKTEEDLLKDWVTQNT